MKNDPPQIFFSTRPALLILIDGSPELRPVKDTKLERLINTRVLMLHDPSTGKFYLHLMDGWLEAGNVDGPWVLASNTPGDIERALETATAGKQVDLLDGSAAGPNVPRLRRIWCRPGWEIRTRCKSATMYSWSARPTA